MSQNLVRILEKVLSQLECQSHSRKKPPRNKLSQGQKITEDAEWLNSDKDADFVDEASVITLKKYSLTGINSLLNPEHEDDTVDEETDQEIYGDVMKAWEL